MFGNKKESKKDMRNGMWETGPKTRADFGEDRPIRESGSDIVRPTFRPQAEGQISRE